LFTNLVAVPLSSVILFGEIVLCTLFFIEPVSKFIGSIIQWLIWLMNSYIEKFDQLPFSIWDQISVNIPQTIFLTAFVICFSYWLMENKRQFFWISTLAVLGFVIIEAFSRHTANQQFKVIVYNIPKRKAIEIISGTEYCFIGDSTLRLDQQLQNFHILPAHILFRFGNEKVHNLKTEFVFNSKKIVVIDTTFKLKPAIVKDTIDLLILSSNPRLYIGRLDSSFVLKKIILDSSVPQWKAKLWKKDCDSLKIPYHDVTEKGAFVMNL
jgi:competence protein ComEC